MMKLSDVKLSRVFTADMQILGSAFCFGIGFLGQRAVMVSVEFQQSRLQNSQYCIACETADRIHFRVERRLE